MQSIIRRIGAVTSVASLAGLVLLPLQNASRNVLAQSAGLVAAYGFDEPTGNTATDSSGSGNTGTITAAVRTSSGRFGGALQFNGTTSGVAVADAPSLDLTTGMTLEAWVFPTVVPSNWRAVIGKDVDRYYLMASTNGNVPGVGGTWASGANPNFLASSALSINTWTHLAATYDGTMVRLYANGVQVAGGAMTGSLSTSNAVLTIGNNVYGERFTGLIDEVRIYNRALTSGEIQNDMSTPVSGPAAPRLNITQPASGSTIVGATVPVSYTTSGDLTGVDHVHFQLDSQAEVMDLSFDGSFQFANVPAGAHVIGGYLVRADHSKIPGTDAAPVSFTTTLPDTTPPTAPSGLTATPSGTQVTLNWTAATDNVGVTGYRVERCQTSGCTNFAEIATTAAVSYVNSSLLASTTYGYRVRATDAAGLLGPYSNVISATTGTAPPVPTGLVAAYGFDEGSGNTVTDASGSGNTGTITAAVRTASGMYGGALQFNGTTAVVTVPDATSLDLTTGMTLEAWVFPTVALSNWRAVIGKDVDRYYLMGSTNGNVPGVGGTWVSGGNRNFLAPTALGVNVWTHLAATYDGTNVSLYRNGVQVVGGAMAGALTTSNAVLTIGNNVYGEGFTGLIDEVRIYNRALTSAEIQTDMGTPLASGPHLAITAPAAGATLATTTLNVAYTASGDLIGAGVDHVHFRLDALPEVMDLSLDGAYQFTNVVAGPHTLAGYLVHADHSAIPGTNASVAFTTTVPDAIPPTVSMTAPANGATVSGVVTVSANASDNVGVAGVRFKLDGANVGAEDLTAPYAISLNTATFANGPHTLTATARDLGGNLTDSTPPVAFTISNTNPNDPAYVGQWSALFSWPIVALHAALLPTGKVLTWNDNSATGVGVQLWNPATGTFTAKPTSGTNLFCAGMTFLADGRLMAIGGHAATYVGITNNTIFDPISESWSDAAHMVYPRWYPNGTRLADGRILVVSGAINCPNCLIPGDPHNGLADIAEIYNPTTNLWTQLTTAPLRLPMYPHMFLLPDGRVFASSANEDPIASSVLNLSTLQWTTIGGVLDGGSAVMYAPGKIMKSGTAWNPDYPIKATAASTYVIDMNVGSPAWRQTPAMAFARTEHDLTLLPDGTVLATGGSADSNVNNLAPAVYEAELWSPVTESWATLSAMAAPRLYHSTALLLPDARVLIAGSGTFGIDQLSGQIYSPPYLFKGPRPVITSAPGSATPGSTLSVQTPDAARIGSVTLMAIGSVTHAFDENQRIVPVPFVQGAGAITATLPVNTNLMPPGHYMLFLIDTNGVPSVSTMLRVLPPAASDTTPPTAPSNLTATPSGTQIALNWTPSTDNVGVTGYRVERCQGAACSNFVEIATPTGTSFINTGLAVATAYRYRVRATDAAGLLSPYSNIATATTPGTADTTPPTAPSNLTAAVSGTQVTLNWTAATDNVGVTGYRVERCQTSGCSNFAEIATAAGISYINSGLLATTSYSYRVRASDAAGLLGPYSNIISATTGTAPPVPTGLVAAYGFDEASGTTATDASGTGNTGTITAAVRTASGKYGGALQFNGTTSGVAVPDAPSLDLTTGMTLEAWVFPTVVPSNWRAVIGKDVDRYYLMASTNGNVPGVGGTWASGANPNFLASSALSINTWTHLAATYDGTMVRLYANGVQVAGGAMTGSLSTSNAVLTIGNNVYGERFTGLIDEVRIYNRALTSGEIQIDMTIPIHP